MPVEGAVAAGGITAALVTGFVFFEVVAQALKSANNKIKDKDRIII